MPTKKEEKKTYLIKEKRNMNLQFYLVNEWIAIIHTIREWNVSNETTLLCVFTQKPENYIAQKNVDVRNALH